MPRKKKNIPNNFRVEEDKFWSKIVKGLKKFLESQENRENKSLESFMILRKPFCSTLQIFARHSRALQGIAGHCKEIHWNIKEILRAILQNPYRISRNSLCKALHGTAREFSRIRKPFRTPQNLKEIMQKPLET